MPYIITRTLDYTNHTKIRMYLSVITPETYTTSRKEALPFDSVTEAHKVKMGLTAAGEIDVREK